MGMVGGGIIVPGGRLFRSHCDLYDEYGTMLFGSGHRVEVAKALISLHCSPEGAQKRRRIQSIVKSGSKVDVAPKPALPKVSEPRVRLSEASAPKMPASATTPDVEAEEGEFFGNRVLPSPKEQDVAGTSATLPSGTERLRVPGMGTIDELRRH